RPNPKSNDVNAIFAGPKQHWAVATIGGAVMVVTLLFLFRLPPPPTAISAPLPATAGTTVKPVVQLATRADELLRAETDIRDLRPLFLPTERNATLPELKREPGRTFLDNETLKPSFLESEVLISKDLPSVPVINGKPADQATPLDTLVSEANATSLLGFG